MTVRVRDGVLSVTVDGVKLMSRAVPVPVTARVGFTGASGATGGVQRLTGVSTAATG